MKWIKLPEILAESSFGDTIGQNKQTKKQTKNSECPAGSQVGVNV